MTKGSHDQSGLLHRTAGYSRHRAAVASLILAAAMAWPAGTLIAQEAGGPPADARPMQQGSGGNGPRMIVTPDGAVMVPGADGALPADGQQEMQAGPADAAAQPEGPVMPGGVMPGGAAMPGVPTVETPADTGPVKGTSKNYGTSPAAARDTGPATMPTSRPTGVLTGITTQPGGGMLLNFNDASIDTVLNELSQAGGFIIDKRTTTSGKVTLISRQPIMPQETVTLLNTVLRDAGYAAVQQGRVLKIVTIDKARHANIPVRNGSDPEQIAITDELITQVIPLRYASATQLKQDLTPLISPDADFTANQSSNALVITDTSANIRRVVEIVQALDTHLADASDVKVFQLKYAVASTTAKMVNDLFKDGAGTSGGAASTAGGRGGAGGRTPPWMQQQPQQQQASSAGLSVSKVNATSDDRTNTVVVTGPTDTLLVVARVIKELDANPAMEETIFVYKLKNAQSLEVQNVVNSLFNGSAGTTNSGSTSSNWQTLGSSSSTFGSSSSSSSGGLGSSRTSGRSSTGNTGNTGGTRGGNSGGGGFSGGGGRSGLSSGATATAAQLAGQVTIIADPDTNSLLVRTAPSNYERVRKVLDELDRAVPQVLIKVLIAEVTHDNTRDLGTEFSALNLRASGNGQKIGTDFGLAAQPSGLVVQALETNVTATLFALETEGKLDVLSRPYILASDNQLASITVGQEVPFITNSRITDAGQTINTVEYQDIGILLQVIPHINTDGMVILDVAPEISALSGTTVPISDTVSSPVIAKRSAQTRVGVGNGQTIVIGGLMQDQKTTTISKVPLLGDIPLLGELFKHSKVDKSKTELLIFLTPTVAAQASQLQGISKESMRDSMVPNAVEPGAFDRHMRDMQSEQPSTQPAQSDPATNIGGLDK